MVSRPRPSGLCKTLTGTGDAELLVDLLVRARGTPCRKTKRLRNIISTSRHCSIYRNRIPRGRTSASQRSITMRFHQPSLFADTSSVSTHRERLNGKNRCAATEHAELVLGRLRIEDAPARDAHNPRLHALTRERRGRLKNDRHLGPARHEGERLLARGHVRDGPGPPWRPGGGRRRPGCAGVRTRRPRRR